ncbi:MAG: hypothetical protein HYW89_01340 [Candidatus Sungiibacteriota bacterium]|uniref:Cyclic-phosphate processing Receiver domain-containing protein n=1 Tax=Candidatus Sungiibacteriota bacterium TaxID=2750080 RepID=A0A7T5USC9_9BACT|nr:MAG: hypothetical protein HYW89_01340 [Candidatus Sungbacteria bacterium]
MKIFLDDLVETERKDWKPEGWVGVKNFTEFQGVLEKALAEGEKIEGLSFDNDLGEGEMEGWEIAKWLTETHPEIFAENPELRVHSANPEGRKSLEHYFGLGHEHFRELIDAKERPHPWGEMERKR